MTLSRADLNQRIADNLQLRLDGQKQVPKGNVAQGSGGVPLASHLGTGAQHGVGSSGLGKVEVGERQPQLMTAAQLKAQAGKPSWLNSLPFRSPTNYQEIVRSLEGFERAGSAQEKLARLDQLEQQVADWKTGNAQRGHKNDSSKLRELSVLEGQIGGMRQML